MDWNTQENRSLVSAILSLRDAAEARRFLRDLLTKEEIAEFAGRFAAAEMLSRKEPYSAIERATGLSSATIARVSKWLKGRQGGYRTVISRLHHKAFRRARGLS